MGSYAGTRGFISHHLRACIGSLRAELLLSTRAHPGALAQDSGAHARIRSCPRVRIVMPTHGTPEPACGARHTRARDCRYSRAHPGTPRAQMLLPSVRIPMLARGTPEPSSGHPHTRAQDSPCAHAVVGSPRAQAPCPCVRIPGLTGRAPESTCGNFCARAHDSPCLRVDGGTLQAQMLLSARGSRNAANRAPVAHARKPGTRSAGSSVAAAPDRRLRRLT